MPQLHPVTSCVPEIRWSRSTRSAHILCTYIVECPTPSTTSTLAVYGFVACG
jgi:hypothetical protein